MYDEGRKDVNKSCLAFAGHDRLVPSFADVKVGGVDTYKALTMAKTSISCCIGCTLLQYIRGDITE